MIKILILLFLIIPIESIGNEIDISNYKNEESVVKIIKNSEIQNLIKPILSNYYYDFIENFEIDKKPIILKKFDAIFLEGLRNDLSSHSAAVIHPDGRIYLAIFYEHSNTLKYFTNDTSCAESLHLAIYAFSKKFDNHQILYMSHAAEEPFYREECDINSLPKKRSMSISDQSIQKQISKNIWNEQLAESWNYNENVADILADAIDYILICSENLNFVAKPPKSFRPSYLYLATYHIQIIQYITGIKRNRPYRICIIQASSRYRTDMELASMAT